MKNDLSVGITTEETSLVAKALQILDRTVRERTGPST